MPIVAQLTVVLAEALPVPSLTVVKVAVLSYLPHESLVVLLVTWTLTEAPAASVTPFAPPYVRVWFGALPPMAQLASLAGVVEAIDQETPVPPGSGSLTLKPVAAPAPLFVTVTVNPIAPPALTDAASAVF